MRYSMTSPVHVGRAFESLRNSDFDTLSAMGEVIDNSIQANSKNIHIKIKKIQIRKNKYDLTEIAFADDGTGMGIETLSKCLQLGFSDRYNDRDGIGRFGVGMTLGAVTQCTRIEVYSKPRGGGWNFTYIDLNEMKDKEDPVISPPVPSEIPREYADMMADYGTLVIWKNLDREDAKIEDMLVWIGRTYRKFIGDQIIDKHNHVTDNPNKLHIFLDHGEGKEEISAFDPLYVTRTKYNKEVTQLEAPIILEEVVHKIDLPPTKQTEISQITIRMSLLPEAWRKEPGYGNRTENRIRHVPANEGISILRNNREVFYGHIQRYSIKDDTSSHYKGFIDMDRFWGCEISFDATMDHWFSIKNIKVGARPIKELREKIEKAINETIYDFRKEIRKTWKSNKAKEQEETGGSLGGTTDAENIISETNPNPDEPEPNDITKLIQDSGNTKNEIQKKLQEKISKNPVTFVKKFDMDERGHFIDITTRAGRIIVNLNMKNPFFQKFLALCDDVRRSRSDKKMNLESVVQDMETNMNLLIASYALARREIRADNNEQTRDVTDRLILNWTHFLDRTVRQTLEKTD